MFHLPPAWRTDSIRAAALVAALLAAGLAPGAPAAARAQGIDFDSLLPAMDCTRLLTAGGRLYGATDGGGVLIWDPASPGPYRRWTTAEGLTSDRVVALAHSGRSLWVATRDGGLTRVREGISTEFRPLTGLEQLQLSAVAAVLRENAEIAYYGLPEGGVGVVIDGLAGIVYTSATSGLLDDRIVDLALHDGALWVATPAGVSRFAANVFSNRLAGLPSLDVRTLLAGDGLLLAGTAAGVARWEEGAQAWQVLPGLDGPVTSLAASGGVIWALLSGEGTEGRLWAWDGSAWSGHLLPLPRTRVVAATDRLWAAGQVVEAGMSFRSGRAFLAGRTDAGWESWQTDESLMPSASAVAVDRDGGLWVGSRTADAFGRRLPGGWQQVWRTVTESDSAGMFDHNGPILDLKVLPTGEAWVIQFDTGGLLRWVPPGPGQSGPGTFDHVTPANSPLSTRRLLQLVPHPDGPLLILGESGADVLVEPSAWRDPASWVHLGAADGLGGERVVGAAFTSRDVAWFAVREIGLVRWDLNGAAGPGAGLTWTATADDLWSAPVTQVFGAQDLNLRSAVALAAGPDGSLWAAVGTAVLRLGTQSGLTLLEAWREKATAEQVGLLPGGIRSLAVGPAGDVWIAGDTGLNRLRRGSKEVDAFVSPVTYVQQNLALLYSSQVIAGLPGGGAMDIALSADGKRLVAGFAGGAVTARIPEAREGQDPLSGLYAYPNPFRPRQGALKLGGIAADVITSPDGIPLEGGATVAIFNLEGELVFAADHVEADSPFWDGLNSEGAPVVTGLYVVKVTLRGRTTAAPLAVVR